MIKLYRNLKEPQSVTEAGITLRYGAVLRTSLPLVIIERVVDRKESFDLTDAQQAFIREGCTLSAGHASIRVEYWKEWVKKFELIFVNTFFTHKKNVSLD